MKTQMSFAFGVALALFAYATRAPAQNPVGTAFIYQGRLLENASPANGLYSFQFRLIQNNNGQYQGPILTNQPVSVSNGLFTTTLDFGEYFGSRVFDLEIGVRTNGNTGAFTMLSPNQPIRPTPLAMVAGRALSLGASLPSSTLFDAPDELPPFSVNSTSLVARLNADLFDGYDSGAFWKLGGNAGGSSLLGTLDSRPLDLIVNGVRGLRIDPATNVGAIFPNIIGGAFSSIAGTTAGTVSGGRENTIDQSFAATISGGWRNQIQTGGQDNTIGGGQASVIQQDGIANTIGGGAINLIEAGAQGGTVGGGRGNQLGAGTVNSTIGGGRNNVMHFGVRNSLIGGGSNNIIEQASEFATIGGGAQNSISLRVSGGTVSGGINNRVASGNAAIAGGAGNVIVNAAVGIFEQPATGSAIGGGENNNIHSRFDFPFGVQADAIDAVISGGLGNVIEGASYASIPGGANNAVTGNYGLAAGRRAKVNHAGSFVWADSTDADFASTAANQFLVRASGGVGLGTANPAAKLHLYSADNPTTFRIQSSGGPGLGRIEFVSDPQGNPNEWRPAYIQSLDAGGFTGGLGFYLNGTGFGNFFSSVEVMRLINGRVGIGTNNPQTALHVVGTVTATAFNPPSDRNLKENFTPVEPREVLDKVATMPISRWNFKGDDATPHVGPMAQDFHAAFGLGTDDKHIATVDADGVALAAIQGLNQKVEEQAREIQVKDQKLSELEKRLAVLERLIQSARPRD